ncbi:Innexin inx2 [Orchesella cincta]|uniref:Innexin n=1 Tax=Orchesella cincta TaxID=48709 RepID=A0A1D2NFI2_ORCCI|nr:Innexin inx2 [Orchesella cincta]
MITNVVPASISSVLKSRTAKTDNLVFRLHYQVTCLIFLVASAILVTNQLFGVPIDCYTDNSDSMESGFKQTIDNLCWVTSVFTVKEHLCRKIGIEVTYPGIGIFTPTHTPFDVHVTYRVLFFVLFLQGMSFYLPKLIWKSWESHKMKMLSAELENPMLEYDKQTSIIRRLTDYILFGQSNGSIKYAFHLHFCEMMNLVIVGMNIWVTDYLFRKEFIGYGINTLAEIFSDSYYDPECNDPISSLFPRIAKCEMRSFGPSGSIVNKDIVCVLPLNDFNSCFFKFIWAWFAVLLTTSVFWLMFRVVTFYSRRLRYWLLSRKAGRLPVLTSHNHDGGNCCFKICSRISYADWVILMQLGNNMDPLIYKYFLETVCQQIYIKETEKIPHVRELYSPV